jgi:shikimate dehydrogenase
MTTNEAPPDRYALVGHPVAHSRSPQIHTLFARETGEHLTYGLIDAEPERFAAAVRAFVAAGGKGLNVTVPHKEAAYELVDERSATAELAGAVNTIKLVDGKLYGDNTDGVGLVRDLVVNLGQALVGRRVLVLGAGGAARGILAPLLAAQPLELVVANRTRERADALVARFAASRNLRAVAFEALRDLAAFDVLLNATSAGLKGEAPPLPTSLLGPKSFCYDLIYSTEDTPFVSWARAHGAGRAEQGWGMLIEQAAESFYIWRGVRPDTKAAFAQLAR